MPTKSAGMPDFPDSPTLPQLQTYIREVCAERGWDKSSELETFMLLVEEVGEVAKALRARRHLFLEAANVNPDELASELADVLSYVLDLANRTQVDLESALRHKEAINATRTWG